MCVRECVWVCVHMCACVFVRREGRNHTSVQICQVFVAAWYARKVLHVYINDYLLMSYLENISHRRSTIREDSTNLAGETPLTESGSRV